MTTDALLPAHRFVLKEFAFLFGQELIVIAPDFEIFQLGANVFVLESSMFRLKIFVIAEQLRVFCNNL